MIYYYYRKPMGIFSPVYVIAFYVIGTNPSSIDNNLLSTPCVQSLYFIQPPHNND